MKRYIRASFDNWIPSWLQNDKNALRALARAGIDLKNATFSTSKTGKSGEQYTVYLLQKQGASRTWPTVWIPGLYNDNEYFTDPYDGGYKAVKYIAKKNLPIADIVYVNIADNAKPSKERYQDPRYDQYGKYAGQYYKDASSWDAGGWSAQGRTTSRGRYGSDKRDKSGYIIPNPDERLLKFYSSKEGLDKLAETAQEVHDDLAALKDDLFNVDSFTFGKDREGNLDYSSTAYENLMHRFGNSVRDYRIALHSLESVKQSIEKYGEDMGLNSYATREAFKQLRSIRREITSMRKILETEYDW